MVFEKIFQRDDKSFLLFYYLSLGVVLYFSSTLAYYVRNQTWEFRKKKGLGRIRNNLDRPATLWDGSATLGDGSITLWDESITLGDGPVTLWDGSAEKPLMSRYGYDLDLDLDLDLYPPNARKPTVRFGSVRFRPRSLNPRFGSTGSGSFRFRFPFFSPKIGSPLKKSIFLSRKHIFKKK